MRNWFWNAAQGRLRTLWRLLLAFGAAVALMLPFSCVGSVLLLIQNAELLSGDMADGLGSLFSGQTFLLIQAIVSTLTIVLTVLLVSRLVDKRRFVQLGWHIDKRWWADLGFGLGLGALLMTLIFLTERALGWVVVTDRMAVVANRYPFGASVLSLAVTYVCVGVYEELLMRGYLLRNLAEGLNHSRWGARGAVIGAWLLSSALFALLHFVNPNATWLSTLTLVASGLFLGLGYVLTGELALPIGLHITWNFFQGVVYGLPVSGLASTASFVVTADTGPALWTGGAFGPEAGLLGLMALGLGSALIYGWVRWRRGRAAIRQDLAIYIGLEG